MAVVVGADAAREVLAAHEAGAALGAPAAAAETPRWRAEARAALA